jgi:catecholate siderophore receptor
MSNITKNDKPNVALKPLAIAISTAVALCSQTAIAEDVALPKLSIEDQQTHSYGAEKSSNIKQTQDLVDTPKTINIVNEQAIKDQGVTSLEDALRNVSGVSTFGAGEGGGGNITTADVVTIRGFDANGSIYTDGIREVAGYSRDLFNSEQVEVTKGSSSTLSGKGSAGGTVNITTKTAHLVKDTNSLGVSYDEGGLGRVTGDFNRVLSDTSAIRFNVMGQKGGDYWDNGEEEYQSAGFASSFYTEVREGTNVTFNVQHLRTDDTPALGFPTVTEEAAAATGLSEGTLPESLLDNYYGINGVDQDKVRATSATLVINHKLNDDWSIRNQTRIGKADREAYYSRPMFSSDDPTQVTYYRNDALYLKNDSAKNTLAVNQLDAIGQIDVAGMTHDLVVGTEVYRETEKVPTLDTSGVTLSSTTTDYANPNVTATGRIVEDGYTRDTRAIGLALYALDTITFNDQWQASAGARYEKYRVKGDFVSRGTALSGKADANLLSWNLGLNFKPTPNSTVYASFANAEQPLGSDLAFSGSNEEQLQQYVSLDPLESISAEIGTKWSIFDDRLLLSAALFETRKDVYDRDDDGNRTDGGEQQNRGIELSASGQITDHLNLLASFTHQDSEVTENNYRPEREGNGLSAAPKKSAALWMTYDAGPLVVGAGAEYNSGNIYWRGGEPFYDTGSVTLVNAMASYQFTDQLKAQLNVTNLTDKVYVTDISARGHYNVGSPRNIKLSLQYDF